MGGRTIDQRDTASRSNTSFCYRKLSRSANTEGDEIPHVMVGLQNNCSRPAIPNHDFIAAIVQQTWELFFARGSFPNLIFGKKEPWDHSFHTLHQGTCTSHGVASRRQSNQYWPVAFFTIWIVKKVSHVFTHVAMAPHCYTARKIPKPIRREMDFIPTTVV